MSGEKKILVETKTYSAEFSKLGTDHLYMFREVRHETIDHDIDVFGSYWVMSWGDVRPGLIHARRDGKLIPVQGRLITFLPPFSIVEWEIRPGAFQFHTLFSYAALPDGTPREPVTWFNENAEEPVDSRSAIRMLKKATGLVPIGTSSRPSAVALRVKKWLEKHYRGRASIAEAARALNVSHTVMGRLFKQAYGLSPVAYRNKLRISDSIRLMLFEKQKVSSAAYEVGFADLSRYNRLFRRQMKTNPNKYR